VWTTIHTRGQEKNNRRRNTSNGRPFVARETTLSGYCQSRAGIGDLATGICECEIPAGREAGQCTCKKGALVIECDELWSFVGDKQNQQWVWLALDRDSKDIVGCFIGSRDEEGAIGLWQSLPECYLDATTYTDFWEAYAAIFYDKTLHQVGKETGLTNHIERFNNTLRQRVSRLVRKTLSFSKKLENHIGAIWSFIPHYNATHARKALLP
jgi:insertion element IS1 protein InsB